MAHHAALARGSASAAEYLISIVRIPDLVRHGIVLDFLEIPESVRSLLVGRSGGVADQVVADSACPSLRCVAITLLHFSPTLTAGIVRLPPPPPPHSHPHRQGSRKPGLFDRDLANIPYEEQRVASLVAELAQDRSSQKWVSCAVVCLDVCMCARADARAWCVVLTPSCRW